MGVSKKKKEVGEFFFPTARDRRGGGAKELEIGEASQLPRFLVLFFSAAFVVHKSVSEALVQTRGSRRKQGKWEETNAGATRFSRRRCRRR